VTWGRDVRNKDVTMRPAPVAGGLEPQVLPTTRQSIRAAVLARVDAYTPEWTDRGRDDAGVAIVKAHGTLAEAVHLRLNRLPRRLALDYLQAAGVRPLAAAPARAIGSIEVSERATAPLAVAAGTVFVTPAGATGPALETQDPTGALPGRLGAVAVLADGWLVLDQVDTLAGLQPFGARPRPPAELWIGLDIPVAPEGVLSLAVELVVPPGRPAVDAAATQENPSPPLIRWEAVAAGGAVELAVEFDDTRGLSRGGVIAFRAPGTPTWTPSMLPGRAAAPLRWLRARLLTSTFSSDTRLKRILLNGVRAVAQRSVRGEVAEPVERRSSGGSRYRLARVPVVPGSVVLEVTESGDPFGGDDAGGTWQEVPSLAAAPPDARVFELDPTTGVLTFGDGVHGRAVPDGYRNVVALVYATGGGTTGLPRPDDLLAAERSVPQLTGLRVASITTGTPAETLTSLLKRGPTVIRSRLRAVAPADYAAAALAAPGVDVARASCLPGVDPAGGGAVSPGTVGVVVVPRVADIRHPPVPSTDTLRVVADHLARTAGVAGARVVAVAPRYREVAVHGLLVGAGGADLPGLVSAARDRIDDWLDPLVGGDGRGWAFGGPVRWNDLIQMLLGSVPRLEAASRVSFRVDGRQLPACADVVLSAGELVWPGTHLLEAVPAAGGGS
jgi:predicted phage baseplate assembly protein